MRFENKRVLIDLIKDMVIENDEKVRRIISGRAIDIIVRSIME